MIGMLKDKKLFQYEAGRSHTGFERFDGRHDITDPAKLKGTLLSHAARKDWLLRASAGDEEWHEVDEEVRFGDVNDGKFFQISKLNHWENISSYGI